MRRIEGAAKVSGSLVFTEDMPLPGLVHAKLVPSYVPSATIRAVRTDAAAAVPGVVRVLTGADLGLEGGPDAPLAVERVYHVGQAVAAVIASSAAAAADAAGLVEVEYDALPAAVEANAALNDGAPRVLPEVSVDAEEASIHGAASAETEGTPKPEGNITAHVLLRRGDAAAEVAGSEVVEKGTFLMPRVHQAFIEPHVVTARAERDGSVTVWTPTQGMTEVRPAVAKSLGVDQSRVLVVPMPVGGGFGGKFTQFEPLVAHLARKVGRPVRLQLTRNEEFLLGWPAPASEISVELGASRNGSLRALRAQAEYDNGATGGWHAGITAELLASTYRLPAFEVAGREIATNKLPVTAYRAPGASQAYFALESVIDELARTLGTDPIELRLKNASREGDPRGDGSPWPRIGLVECLEAARRNPVYSDPKQPGEGVGVAAGAWIGGFGPAAAACRMETDGTLSLHLGSIDISGSDTGLTALAAEVFGTSPDRVRIFRTDTASSPAAPSAGGSSTTYSVAPAVERAVLEVRRQVLELAGSQLEAAVEDLELADGQVQVKGAPFRSVPLTEVVEQAEAAGGPGPIHSVGRASVATAAPMFTVHVARVRVDTATGAVRVTRYAAIQDVGHALNETDLIGQIHGGIVQGLGRALGEEISYDDSGQPRTATFADYMLPTADLVPEIEIELVEVPSEHGAKGARGAGEPPVVPVLAAVANAIRDATGERLTRAPFDLESVAGALNRA
jgi:CO/xanthine dehydrogenase Mo-binding subunit